VSHFVLKVGVVERLMSQLGVVTLILACFQFASLILSVWIFYPILEYLHLHNILEPVLERPSKKESKTTVDSKNLVEPLESR
jgi:hypothetical protein